MNTFALQVKILVPNCTAGLVIGKQGSYVSEIKEATGAFIQISQKSKDINLPERCITIAGMYLLSTLFLDICLVYSLTFGVHSLQTYYELIFVKFIPDLFGDLHTPSTPHYLACWYLSVDESFKIILSLNSSVNSLLCLWFRGHVGGMSSRNGQLSRLRFVLTSEVYAHCLP